jgi:hypothetical protein
LREDESAVYQKYCEGRESAVPERLKGKESAVQHGSEGRVSAVPENFERQGFGGTRNVKIEWIPRYQKI